MPRIFPLSEIPTFSVLVTHFICFLLLLPFTHFPCFLTSVWIRKVQLILRSLVRGKIYIIFNLNFARSAPSSSTCINLKVIWVAECVTWITSSILAHHFYYPYPSVYVSLSLFKYNFLSIMKSSYCLLLKQTKLDRNIDVRGKFRAWKQKTSTLQAYLFTQRCFVSNYLILLYIWKVSSNENNELVSFK